MYFKVPRYLQRKIEFLSSSYEKKCPIIWYLSSTCIKLYEPGELLEHVVQWDSQICLDSSEWTGDYNHSDLIYFGFMFLISILRKRMTERGE